ncbi:hypothetical protein M514_03524 [Trichuris suis]|uniref:Uncharacterized protein n=1 Tax=Trichuris suis TaxID=68888 RepID=A0A085NP79_9BILA|nr:hypothetical protein M513_03524 [Trichuris suis]KFD71275.1 hypothetical protein M514_03524 [Trichuris suis]
METGRRSVGPEKCQWQNEVWLAVGVFERELMLLVMMRHCTLAVRMPLARLGDYENDRGARPP